MEKDQTLYPGIYISLSLIFSVIYHYNVNDPKLLLLAFLFTLLAFLQIESEYNNKSKK